MNHHAQRFLDVFRVGALQAGAVAKRFQGQVRVEEKAGQATPEAAALTAVDLATQDVLLHIIHDALPGVAIDAEEETDTVSLFPRHHRGEPLVVIDPIDGTLGYSQGSLDYAVMGALLLAGRFAASLIYYPGHDLLAWAIRGRGCWMQRPGRDAPKPVTEVMATGPILVSPAMPRSWCDALQRSGEEHLLVSRCSAVESAAPVLQRGKAAISIERADRRRAIGLLLTVEAGGAVRFGDHIWNGEDPEELSLTAGPTIAAASASLAADLCAAIRGCD